MEAVLKAGGMLVNKVCMTLVYINIKENTPACLLGQKFYLSFRF